MEYWFEDQALSGLKANCLYFFHFLTIPKDPNKFQFHYR